MYVNTLQYRFNYKGPALLALLLAPGGSQSLPIPGPNLADSRPQVTGFRGPRRHVAKHQQTLQTTLGANLNSSFGHGVL